MAFAFAFACLSLASLRTSALERVDPELVVEAGSGLDVAKLREHLRIELVGASPQPTQVRVSTVGPRTRVELVFADGANDARETDLSDAAPGELERVLSLAIAEQARTAPRARTSHSNDAGDSEVPAIPSSTVTPLPLAPRTSPATTSDVARPAVDDAIRIGVYGAFGGRMFGKAGTLLVEPRIGVAFRHGSGARLDLGLLFAHAESTDPLGRVVANAFGGSVGLSFDRQLGRSYSLRLGPRLDVSAAFAEGSPASVGVLASAARAPLVVLVGETELRFVPARSFGLTLAFDLGGGLAGLDLRADDRTPSALYGFTFGARLGFVWGSLAAP